MTKQPEEPMKVRMADIVLALRANGVHAASCAFLQAKENSDLHKTVIAECDCWCAERAEINVTVNG